MFDVHSAIDRGVAEKVAARVEAVFPEFDAAGFVDSASELLPGRTLLERLGAVVRRLAVYLPNRFPAAASILTKSAAVDPPPGRWEGAVCNAYVAEYGLRHPRESLDSLETLTTCAASELALRPFLAHHGERTWSRVEDWAAHRRPEVRRLAVAGTRPRAPWGPIVPGLADKPERNLALLERLCDDPDVLVRRAVADHLFDVALDHPDAASEAASRWIADGREHAGRVAGRGLRRLAAQGHQATLAMLGFASEASVEVVLFECRPCRLGMAGAIELHAVLRSTCDAPQRLVVGYAVHYAREEGDGATFRWRTLELSPGEQASLRKRHCSGDRLVTDRERGTPRLELRVAGEIVAETTPVPTDAPA